jgi:HD-like signal output (HDOD) protein
LKPLLGAHTQNAFAIEERISLRMGWFDALKKAVGSPRIWTRPVLGEIVAPGQDAPTGQHLLVVTDDTTWFSTTSGELHHLLPHWECHHAATLTEAVAQLRTQTFQAIVMPPRAAADVTLTAALERQVTPIHRVIRCDRDSREETQRWAATGACVLPPQGDGAELTTLLLKNRNVQGWPADAGMKELLAQCRKLPAMPNLYSQVTLELSSPHGSMERVAQSIARDPVMTAKILSVANSASFAPSRPITDAIAAVMFLGAERTRSLILLAGVFSQFQDARCPGFSLEQLWNHSLQVAVLARIITIEQTRDTKLAEMTFTAGLIHDLGKLVLVGNLPALRTVLEKQPASPGLQLDAIWRALESTHADFAACLLGSWGLPRPVVEAVSWHHCPAKSADTSFTPLTAVHVANVFAYEMRCGSGTATKSAGFDYDYLLRLGLGERRNAWRDAVGLPPRKTEAAEFAEARRRWSSATGKPTTKT